MSRTLVLPIGVLGPCNSVGSKQQERIDEGQPQGLRQAADTVGGMLFAGDSASQFCYCVKNNCLLRVVT